MKLDNSCINFRVKRQFCKTKAISVANHKGHVDNLGTLVRTRSKSNTMCTRDPVQANNSNGFVFTSVWMGR